MNRLSLYFNTLLYLKPEQIWRRVLFRLRRPKPDLRPAPPLRSGTALKTAPAAMPVSFLGDGRFRFLNEEHRIDTKGGWNNPALKKLWLYNLHYFDWLRQLGLSEADGGKTIGDWIVANPPGHGNGWEPYTLSLRIVNWIKWHLSGHRLTPEALHSLAVQVRFLNQRLERHLLANHYLANAKALVFAGHFFTGSEADRWLNTGYEIYREQLPEQILKDGGHFELSPMYHCIILEDLLDLVNLGASLHLNDIATRMLNWLAAMTGPDGKIALLNDAAFGIAIPPRQLCGYAEKLGFMPPRPATSGIDMPDSGYARLSRDKWTLICDGAMVGPDYQPGHAHADALTFELWHEGVRLLVDSGTGEYIHSPLRREQRETAGHNCVMIDGKNSSEVWGSHRVAKRAGIVERSFDGGTFSAAHNGYAPVIHKREWRFRDGKVLITDRISGTGTHQIDVFWHFAPDCRMECTPPVVTAVQGEKRFAISIPDKWAADIGKGHFSPEFGIFQEAPVIRWHRKTTLPLILTTEIGECSR